jgi:hypothetical protein
MGFLGTIPQKSDNLPGSAVHRLPVVRVLLTFFLCVLVARAAEAQPATGAITGNVTGDRGNRLSSVTVTVQNQISGAKSTAVTDEEGHYSIADLPVDGEYRVGVTLAGFAEAATENVTLVANAILVVNFKLKLSVSESVVVTAPALRLETAASDVRQTVSEQLTHALPLAGRNFIPLAMLTAGFTGNPNYPSPQGQLYFANNVIVDGASHFSKWRSAPRTFYSGYGLESIKEVRVLTNRFSAEYGETLAAVTTAVTRAGTDEVRGSALLFVQNSALNSIPEFASVNPDSGSERFGFTVGGPLVKEKTVALVSYEGRRSRSHNIVVSPDFESNGAFVPDNEDEHLAFFRVDDRRSPRHQMMARYNGQWFRWHNEPGGLSVPGTGLQLDNDVHTVLVTDRWHPSGQMQNEARAQFARYSDVRTDLAPSVYVSRAGYSLQGGTIGAFGFGADPEDTWEASDTVSMWNGPHALKLGGGVKYVRAHNASLNYGRGAYFFAGAPAQFPQPYLFVQGLAATPDAAHADPRGLAAFGFLQDDWRVGPVTLNAGVRYDIERVTNVRNFDVPSDKNNVQPRLGVAWDPFNDGKTLVRGGVGLYTQQHLLYYINRVQLEGTDGAVTVSLTPDSPLFPRYPNVLTGFPTNAPLPPRDIQQVDPAFRHPYSVQATAGIERMFHHFTLSADYVFLDGRDLMSLVDANAPASIVKPAQRTVAQADATRPIPALPGQYRNIVILGNEGRSWYRALQVKVDRSVGRLQVMASYTLANAEDMANYQLPEDSRNLAAEKARANTDIRHNVTAGVTWQVPFEGKLLSAWTLAMLGTFHGNRPYTVTWGDDRNGTTQNDARPGGRNTAVTDGYQNVDVSLSRRFATRGPSIEGRVEVFNFFNTTNDDEYVGALLSPVFGQPITAFPKRRVQLAAVVRF